MLNEKTNTTELLMDLFDKIETLFYQNDLIAIDSLLENYKPNNSLPIFSTGLLRCTSRAKDKLPHWNECYDRIKVDLDSMSLDSTRLLRGLKQQPKYEILKQGFDFCEYKTTNSSGTIFKTKVIFLAD